MTDSRSGPENEQDESGNLTLPESKEAVKHLWSRVKRTHELIQDNGTVGGI